MLSMCLPASHLCSDWRARIMLWPKASSPDPSCAPLCLKWVWASGAEWRGRVHDNCYLRLLVAVGPAVPLLPSSPLLNRMRGNHNTLTDYGRHASCNGQTT